MSIYLHVSWAHSSHGGKWASRPPYFTLNPLHHTLISWTKEQHATEVSVNMEVKVQNGSVKRNFLQMLFKNKLLQEGWF